eukprot:TRINITY_DN89774_c0_g1_i1.p1 TRINITY_DN89774_c0_g1~~TRINITY_DN89774_c0_g1_i1.p1  ORF type:complete len:227 (+),score=43.29 TRINITY_DN89774_c0_g1_i1:168-848(+)
MLQIPWNCIGSEASKCCTCLEDEGQTQNTDRFDRIHLNSAFGREREEGLVPWPLTDEDLDEAAACAFGDENVTYSGHLVDGKRHGYKVLERDTGTYAGQLCHDVEHGQGKTVWNDGSSYEGQYSHGKFHGTGKMTWPSKDGVLIYEGQYMDNLKHGTGKFSWPNGSRYEGGWCHGNMHGRAVFTFESGAEKVGYWKDHKFAHWENDLEQDDNGDDDSGSRLRSLAL